MCCLFTWALPGAFTSPPTQSLILFAVTLSSHVNRCEKVCAFSVTALFFHHLPGILVVCGNASQPQIILCTQTPRDKAAPGASALHSPLQSHGVSLHMLPLVKPFPFQQRSMSLPVPPLPKSCCLSWPELSILLLTQQWVQHPLSLAMSGL